MSLSCPVCRSLNLLPQRPKERSRNMTDTAVATRTGSSTTSTGCETGSTTGSRERPVVGVFGAFAKALMDSLAGTTAGCRARSTIGHMVVAKVLGTYRCADCNYTFVS